MQKLIVILGPTASGKSDLAVKLAGRFSGRNARRNFAPAKFAPSVEIVSADSRQVYKGLNIGSGKITRRQMRGIPHYLLDVASPKRIFTVAEYQKLAQNAIKKIQQHGKIPFLAGGTGFYIQSIVDGIIIPEVPPNWVLRKQLEKKSPEELFKILKKLDSARAKGIDSKNSRRLVRAIEIVKTTGKPVSPMVRTTGLIALQIGIKKSPQELKKLISVRLKKRLTKMIAEVRNLHKNGLSWKRLEELGLEYRFIAKYLQKKISLQEAISKIQIESEHFAKRQMTWFKRDQRIHWVKNENEAKKLTQKFLQ